MGAWGEEPYENDTAQDWLGDTGGSLEGISEAFSTTLQVPSNEYLDADDGTICVAACQALVDYHEPKKPSLLGRVFRKGASRSQIEVALIDKARQALDRVVANNSELAELWKEAEPNGWLDSIGNIRTTLDDLKRQAGQ